MNSDQESLLSPGDRPSVLGWSTKIAGQNGHSRWKKNIYLVLIALFIAACMAIYFYLNMVAIDGNPPNSNRYKPLSRRKPMLDHESIFSDSGPSMIKLSDLLAHCIVALRIGGQEVVNLSLAHNNKLGQVGSKGKTLEGVDDVVTGADLKSHQMILNTIKDSYRRLRVVSEEDDTVGFENMSLEDDILPIERRDFARLLRNNLHEIEGQHADRGSLVSQDETLVWIDPLDATKEYSENLTEYVTLMACIVHKSVPIAGVIFKPFTNETFWSMIEESPQQSFHSPDLTKAIAEAQKQTDGIKIIVSRSHAGDVKNFLERSYGSNADIISAGGSGYKTIELVRGRVDAYMHLTNIKKWDICAPAAILNSITGGNITNLIGERIGFGDPRKKVNTEGLIATQIPGVHRELVALVSDSRSPRN